MLKKISVLLAAVILLCFGLIVGALIESGRLPLLVERKLSQNETTPRQPVVIPPATTPPTKMGQFDTVSLAKKARAAVVLVEVFDNQHDPIGVGSGFFVSDDGLLVTNYHVIEKASYARVKTERGDDLDVKGAAHYDQDNDLAMLAVTMPPGQVPFLSLGKSENVEIGDHVAVIGSPLGLEGSVSEGIISARRELPSITKDRNEQRHDVTKRDWLQITAAISPGSSGSPVLDAAGDVIGVATMTAQGGESLNFAVPAELVTKIIQATRAKNSAAIDLTPLHELAAANTTAKQDMEWKALMSPEYQAITRATGEVQLAVIRKEAADWNKVLTCSKAFVAKFPDSNVAYHCLGDTYKDMGRSEEAIAAYQQAIKLDPDDDLSWESLGCLFKAQGQDTQANFAFSRAISIKTKDLDDDVKESPKLAGFHKAGVLDRLGDIYHSAGNNKAAKRAYLNAMQAGPDAGVSLHSLGEIYAEEGNESEAFAALFRWCSLVAKTDKNPGQRFSNAEAAAWAELSLVYDKLHQDDASLRCFIKAKRLGLK